MDPPLQHPCWSLVGRDAQVAGSMRVHGCAHAMCAAATQSGRDAGHARQVELARGWWHMSHTHA
eukprot:15199983-Alexandrium_andersonii.AAC.1